jgi:ectoine hydroxylase-related dioxygenase (phytanoyl-CoA dioxygenase family)
MESQYGIVNQTDVKSIEGVHLEEYRNQGFTILKDFLVESELVDLRSELDRIYKLQEEEFTKEGLKIIDEEFLARALLCYSDAYLNVARHTELLKYVEEILGSYFLIGLQNGIINMPNQRHHQSSWHRDLPYQNWVSSHSLACNMFICLDVFNEETGGTFVLPGSHKLVEMPSNEFVEKHKVQVVANPGSIVFFDSMLFHKAGYNSSSQIRRGVNIMYNRAILRQQIDLPKMLNGRYSEDPFLKVLLGYDAQSSENVMAFRSRRLEKKK